jgi:hypothetical protein
LAGIFLLAWYDIYRCVIGFFLEKVLVLAGGAEQQKENGIVEDWLSSDTAQHICNFRGCAGADVSVSGSC